MQAILEQNRIAKSITNQTNGVFGNKIGLIGKLFGCWHKQLTRPFTVDGDSYRTCVHCGARKQFDLQTLKTVGAFHYPPAISFNRSMNGN
ncbi:MAG: hypothetical protein M3033_04810 [Acidobacteriota bacterium]|nr:hypothetical protein [Acidobacteriota bacterium]